MQDTADVRMNCRIAWLAMPSCFSGARNAAVGLLSLALLGTGAIAASAAEIVVSWTSVQRWVRPVQGAGRSTSTVRLTLQGGNAIAEAHESVNGRGQRTGSTREGQFRNAIAARNQTRADVTWRVQNARTLVRTTDFLQHTTTIRVTTAGETSCKATISSRLKPGFREYRLNRISDGTPMFLSALSAEDVKCTISN
jgi:hypothetical protein